MKRVQLTDGQSTSVRREDLKSGAVELVKIIKKACLNSSLSYVEVNKALHVVDEELYKRVINSSCEKSLN
ncbi:hypothetical protein CN903_28885 [Bacillus cereus]|uniref:hypothetical protein n=1 Tax=Bacillus cereus TaxID=1396 RepID=UPI000BFC07C5|nr:hypothetical protein [Bacillus cereus]PGK16003.1 hypothetical protein CN903_28885 [Bacillus cereus]